MVGAAFKSGPAASFALLISGLPGRSGKLERAGWQTIGSV